MFHRQHHKQHAKIQDWTCFSPQLRGLSHPPLSGGSNDSMFSDCQDEKRCREEHAIKECSLDRNPEAEILFKAWHIWSGRTCPGFRAVLLFGTLVLVLARWELMKVVMGTVTRSCSNLQTSNKFQAELWINSYPFQIAPLIPPGYS